MSFTNDELNLLRLISMRYQFLVREKKLKPAYADDELMQRLSGACEIQPVDLDRISRLDDLSLVLEIGDILLHYCLHAKQMKDNFRSRFALR
jgi:hypothetical protein